MFGIGYGPSANEKNAFGSLTAASGFATNLGESALSKSSSFFSDIISGDPSKTMSALAPQISGAKGRAQQGKKSLAEFSGRSGGTNSAAAGIDDSTRSSITSLIGSLTGSSASALASIGSSSLSSGMSGQKAGFDEATTMADQSKEKWNDIFNSVSGVVGGIAGLPGVSAGAGKALTSVAGMF